jgi:hypothetical protein
MIIVIGGHSRNIGKTSVVAGLIAALPEFHWTAMKITQYGHGICSANGKTCHCACDDHSWAITEECDRSGKTDSSRFLVSGAARSLWVRTRQGMLVEAMPRIRQELAAAQNAIVESNSILRFVRPDLYLTVLDPAIADFKSSAQRYLGFADAVVLHGKGDSVAWKEVSLQRILDRPLFPMEPPRYVTPALVEFVRGKLQQAA